MAVAVLLHLAFNYDNLILNMTEEITKNEGVKVYEVGYLLLSNIEEDKISDESGKIRDIIEKNGGVFLSEGSPEMKTLAYSMSKEVSGKKQKFNNAYFGWIKFEGNSEMIITVKEELDKLDNILRFLLISTIRENFVATSKKKKPAKFSFGSDEKSDKKKESKEEEKKENVEEIDEEKEEKKLDETIDGLVIE